METLDVVDIWRIKHPNTIRYTRHENTHFGFKQSRIDFFIISCSLEYSVDKVDILPGVKSDHSLLTLSVTLEKEQKWGRGLWKLNVSLLTDTSYINFIKSVIQEAINDSKNLSDNYMIWDFIKCRIRTETIT